jgi:RNA polymerase sigma-70 factor (ECF subfamily)
MSDELDHLVKRATELSPSRLDALVIRAQRGDRRAFERMVEATVDELRAFCATRVPDQDLLDEVVQRAYVTCFEQLDHYQPRRTFLFWLKGIGRNRASEMLRERRRRCSADEQVLEDILDRHRGDELEPGLAEMLAERSRHLAHCLEGLKGVARQLVHRRYLLNQRVNDIASELDRSASWVSNRLHRIRQALRSCIEDREADVL